MATSILSMPYYQPVLLEARFGDLNIQYYSKPGLPDWQNIPPAINLLAEHAHFRTSETSWLVNCGSGALAAYLAIQFPASTFWVSVPDVLTLSCTQLTQKKNGIENIYINNTIDQPSQIMGLTDHCLMVDPKGRMLARRWLVQSWLALKPGGDLLLAGAKDLGINSTIKDAISLFQNGTILDYKKGNRIARMIKEEDTMRLPEWTHTPGIAPGSWYTFQTLLENREYLIYSLPGIFAYAKIDPGSELLCSTIPDLTGHTVLDVGCGYGILGLVAANHGAKHVDMVDCQFTAIACAQRNIEANQVNHCDAFIGDLLSTVAERSYSYVITNPPFHAGKKTNYQISRALIDSVKSILITGGSFQMVANRFLPYKRWLIEVFGNATTLAETPSYSVFASVKEKV
jgi:16S rRNA (guanine1207-N2)-methyltransferase